MTSIISLAQMGRACGIHLIIATQTPRREVVSGMIKANFPVSIAFKTKTATDSMVILDQAGAEDLIGNGDMLLSVNATTERIQCGYIGSSEIDAMISAIESQKGYHKSFSTPYYLPEVEDEGDKDLMRQNGNRPVDAVCKNRRSFHLRVLVSAVATIDNSVISYGIVKLRSCRIQHRDDTAIGKTGCLVQIVCIVIAVGDGEDDLLNHTKRLALQ